MILSLVSKKSKVRHLVDFFSTRCRTSDKNKIDQVSDLAVFFDQQSYSTSCHVRRKGFRREVVHRANLCGVFCPGCKKMAWDVLSRDVLSGSRARGVLLLPEVVNNSISKETYNKF